MPTLDLLPHPITTEGRETIRFDLDSEVTVETLFNGVRNDVWEQIVVLVDGEPVTIERKRQAMVRPDSVIQLRAMTHGGDSNPLAVILSVAVLVAAPYLAGALLPATASASLVAGVTGFIGAAGLFVVNTLFPPRVPNLGDEGETERQYTLAAGSNPVRKYGPLGLVLGEHRVFPDFASRPYTELQLQAVTDVIPVEDIAPVEDTEPVDIPDLDYRDFSRFTPGGNLGIQEGANFFSPYNYDSSGAVTHRNAQWLYQLFDFGIGTLDISDEKFGDTDITDYSDLTTEDSDTITIVHGNVDSAEGGELLVNTAITRTSPAMTTRISVNIVSQRYKFSKKGKLRGETNSFTIRIREHTDDDSGTWTSYNVSLTSPSGNQGRLPVRRSFHYNVSADEYDVEVTLTTADDASQRANSQAALIRYKFLPGR